MQHLFGPRSITSSFNLSSTTFVITLFCLVLSASSAMADAGDDWVKAFKKGKAKSAVKASDPSSVRYGSSGKTETLSGKAILKAYRSFFRKAKRTFKNAEVETGTCTSVGRELGYMAQEWKSENESLSEWIQNIPSEFCNGSDPVPPKLTLIKVLGDDLPHAVVIFQTGDAQHVSGVFHF